MNGIFATPVPFGPKHLIGTAWVLSLVILSLFLLLRVIKVKNHRRVLRIVTVLLLILEVMKQVKAIVDAGGTYPLWALPFQLCSVPLYLFPLVAFGNGKFRDFLLPGTYTISLCAALAMLSFPSTVLGTTDGWIPLVGNYFPIVSFAFHGCMVLFALYLPLSGIYRPKGKDFGKAYLTILFFAVIAIVVNSVFGTDMMFLNNGYGMPFAFILQDFGRAAYYLFMAVLAGAVLFLPFIPFIVKKREGSSSHR